MKRIALGTRPRSLLMRVNDICVLLVSMFASIALVSGCDDAPPAVRPTVIQERPAVPEAPPRRVVGHLDVPASDIARARQEARGLARLGETLAAQTLEGRRLASPSYALLRADTDRYANQSASFAGGIGLVRPAGEGLYLIALSTRREGDRWVDPLYVLSPIEPPFPANGGVEGRVDGWVVGERTIGRHTLPLLLAYHLERGSPVTP